jgi:thiol-disulfide isomerase/thioredoxin
MIGEQNDFLPVYGLLPDFSDEEVERFVALGEEGWKQYRSGNLTGAEKAFRAQLAIFGANPEPYVSLALLEAARGSEKTALTNLRAAVVRGFTDLRRIERSEVWIGLRREPAYLSLQDALPHLIEAEEEWIDWSSFTVRGAPDDLGVLLLEHGRIMARIDAMAPVLGPRLAGLWKKWLERASATSLEAYVVERPEAPDLEQALEMLMSLYAGGPMHHWERLPAQAAGRLGRVSELTLTRFPESSMRPIALVGIAASWNAVRDKKGALEERAVEPIRTTLDEVVTRYPDSSLLATATVGLVRTEVDAGQRDAAADIYRKFRENRSEDPELLQKVQRELGELALELGGLPEFSATTLDGERLGKATLRGKVTVLDFWATWCQPCTDEFPTLQRIAERHGKDVVLLGVNLDYGEDLAVEDLRQWVTEHGVPGRHLYDGQSWDSPLVKEFGVAEIPFNVVLDPSGAVVAVNQHGKQLEKAVKAAARTAK